MGAVLQLRSAPRRVQRKDAFRGAEEYAKIVGKESHEVRYITALAYLVLFAMLGFWFTLFRRATVRSSVSQLCLIKYLTNYDQRAILQVPCESTALGGDGSFGN
jgi:hypothetical protein